MIFCGKLSILQSEAEELNCHDIFIRELSGLADLFVTEQEKSYAAELLEKTEFSTAPPRRRRTVSTACTTTSPRLSPSSRAIRCWLSTGGKRRSC